LPAPSNPYNERLVIVASALMETDYSRLARTEFARERVSHLHALVVGAGAIGNEVVKGLGLIGIGQVSVADPDIVEPRNLASSVLFRSETVQGKLKAEALTAQAAQLFPDTAFRSFPVE